MGFLDWLKPAPPIDDATGAAIERAVDRVEPLIRFVGGYRQRLAPATRHALAHCAEIAARIPGPVDISRAAFAEDPLVHALFGSADDIETMLASSDSLREQGPALHGDGYCALLGMRHREKAGFGAALAGDVLRLDVPQKTLYFSDHTLAEPSPDLDVARERLRAALFDGLLKSFAVHVADARAEQARLAVAHSVASARERHDKRPTDGPEDHVRRLDELGRRLRASTDALRPDALLDTLAECLEAPESFLRIDPVAVAVDRNGVITGGDDDAAAQTLHFMELTARDQRRWVVFLARIRNEEIRRATERIAAARRYIVI